MKAERALAEAYAEWRRLAAATQQAIRARNWTFVLECQEVILKLQPQITQLTCETVGEWRQSGFPATAGGKRIRPMVLELIKLVESNKSLLRSIRERVKSEDQQRQQASRNLKRLQQSYAVAQRTAWTSFS